MVSTYMHDPGTIVMCMYPLFVCSISYPTVMTFAKDIAPTAQPLVLIMIIGWF